MRLIDADALEPKEAYMNYLGCTKIVYMDAIENAPTIEAEPVVRCKECKHWLKTYGWNGKEYATCMLIDRDTSEEFYCAYGEKMDLKE